MNPKCLLRRLRVKWLIPVMFASGTLMLPTVALSQVNVPSLSSSEVDSSFVDPSYVLGSGDQVQITVFDYEEYTGSKVILPDGTITLPLVGSLNAAGLTTEQLAQALTTRLQTLLVNPVVTVELATLRPVTVTVAGEVRRPGPTELQELAEDGGSVPTLSKALMAAGGITQNADIQQVMINREVANGESQTITVNLWEAITSDNAASDVILQEGDSIYVPRLAADAQIDRRLIARSSFAPETVRVRVVGEVKSPGEIEVPPESTVSSAVAIAGGPTEDARLGRVAFIRLGETGQVETETIDLRNLTDTNQIQEGDVIIVPKRDSSSLLDFATRLIPPLGFLLNLIP
ncbi:MAG: polysaccharide biosynthesis/export family protein [Elainellaceae cyanobacterium]